MEDNIKIYEVGGGVINVPRHLVIFTDRSRIVEECPRKRYYQYEYGGTGYVSAARNEDLLIGAAVHEGVDLLFQGGSLDKALIVASDCYLEGKPWGSWLLPEQAEVATADGLHLVKALVYAFYTTYLTQYLEQYEVVEVEEEINWLVRKLEERYLVCMSRPDAILRDKETGKLWHVSHKTAKRFDDISVQKLDVDVQRFAEGYAIWAKYGEPPEGTLYNYFIKGDRRKDEVTNMDRYVTGLIRPYIQRMADGGPLTPERLSYQWEWQHRDPTTGIVSKKRLGKGWEKTSIYNEMDYMTYLDWLREKWVQPGMDLILDSVAGMVPVFFDKYHAWRWLQGIRRSEAQWIEDVGAVLRSGEKSREGQENHYLPLASSQCFNYNHRCSYFDICWRGKQPDDLMADGSLTHREPNHLVEFYEVM